MPEDECRPALAGAKGRFSFFRFGAGLGFLHDLKFCDRLNDVPLQLDDSGVALLEGCCLFKPIERVSKDVDNSDCNINILR